MAKDIHPKLDKVKITCSTCNSEYEFDTVKANIKMDICSNCHPFYNGKNTFARAAGRVEKFNKKYAAVSSNSAQSTSKDSK